MSNTDPDLQSKEKNLPIAIDVLDGNLIVKRHSGRSESWPLGGGLFAGEILDLNPSSLTPLDDDTNSPLAWNSTQLIAADGQTSLDVNNLSEIDTAGIGGLDIGEDYILQTDDSNYFCYFKNKGLYMANISHAQTVVGTRMIVGVSGGSNRGGRVKVQCDAQTYGLAQLMIYIGDADVSAMGDLNGALLSVVGYNNAGYATNVFGEIFLTRVS